MIALFVCIPKKSGGVPRDDGWRVAVLEHGQGR